MIVTKGGKNIYPEELEAYLNNDPVVLESLIFGEAKDGDETVAVEVVPDEDAIREKTGKEELSSDDVQKAVHDVIRRLNRILPNYKTIRRVQIRREKLAQLQAEGKEHPPGADHVPQQEQQDGRGEKLQKGGLGVHGKQGKDKYYATFGQYVLTPEVYAELDRQIRQEGKPSEGKEFGLTAALDAVREKYGMYAFRPDGKSYDIGLPDAYRETMWAYCQ